MRCCSLWHGNLSFLGHLLFVSIIEMLGIAVSIEWQRQSKDFPEKPTQMFQEAPFFHKDMKVMRIFYLNLTMYSVEGGYNRRTVLILVSSVSWSLETAPLLKWMACKLLVKTSTMFLLSSRETAGNHSVHMSSYWGGVLQEITHIVKDNINIR